MGFNKNLLLLLLIVSFSSVLVSSHGIDNIDPTPTTSNTNKNKNKVGSMVKQALKPTKEVLKPAMPMVIEFCKNTENPSLCTETIAPHMKGSFDPIKALETEVKAALNRTRKVVEMIKKSLNDPMTDKKAREALDICKSQYKSMVCTIKEAVELLEQHNVVDTYYKFSSVISDQSTCEDAFKESPGVAIPFPEDSLAVFQLGGNCLAIMDVMVNSRNTL